MKILIVEDNFRTAEWIAKNIIKSLPKAEVVYNLYTKHRLKSEKKLDLGKVSQTIKDIYFDVIVADLHLTNIVTRHKRISNGLKVLDMAKKYQPETTKLLICSGHLDDWLGIEDFDGVYQGREDLPKLIDYLQKLRKMSVLVKGRCSGCRKYIKMLIPNNCSEFKCKCGENIHTSEMAII